MMTMLHNITRAVLPVAAALLLLAGCRGSTSEEAPVHLNRNMDTQEKYVAQRSSAFFVDGSAMRTPPAGTVARGALREDDALNTGKDGDGAYVSLPFTITEADRMRGAERFGIYCSPCHGHSGDGKGKIMEFKYPIPPTSLYEQRVYDMADGYIFEVITNGVRNMPSYREQIPVHDRWRIVAHVRALQANGTPVAGTPLPGAATAPSDSTTQSTETTTETAQ
ncbi:MAG: cytochrome c [Bacteroidota bacterium]|nr:cytochrome c [Bacteroidota bacterium]